MSSTESDHIDAIDHWNRAVEAEDAGDFSTAIAEYDACLCSAPDVATALEAFYRLGLVISRACELNDKDYEDEQLEWRCCELACCEQAARIYEEFPDIWPEHSEINAEEIYLEVQAVLHGQDGPDQTSATECYGNKAKSLQLLRCFSDEVHLEWDADGEALLPESPRDVEDGPIDVAISVQLSDENQLNDDQFTPWAENSQPTANPLKEQTMEEGLSGKMRSLVNQLNSFIKEYETTIARLQKKLEDALQAVDREAKEVDANFATEQNRIEQVKSGTILHANRLLAESKDYESSAMGHLHSQGVYQESVALALDKSLNSRNPLGNAEEALKHAREELKKLREVKKPENHKAVFIGLGIGGFILSLIALVNTRDGGGVFVLINAVFIGMAAVIMFLRNNSAATEMKSLYDLVARETNAAEGYIAGAVKLAMSQSESSQGAARQAYQRAKDRCEQKGAEAKAQYQTDMRDFKKGFSPRVNHFREQVAEFQHETGFVGAHWTDPSWKNWSPASLPAFSACIGTLQTPRIQLMQPFFAGTSLEFEIPALVPFADGVEGKCLLQKATGRAKDACIGATQSMMLRLLANVPPGKVLFTLLDPVGLGQSVAPFMSLADHEEKLITNRAWTEPQHIDEQLSKLTEHMENVIQKYLRNDYASIEEYNQKAGEVAEPYRVLVVFDFPVNFSENAARRLISIAKNGPRCGVYTLVVMDTDSSKKLPYGFNLADLENAATVIHHKEKRFVWDEKTFAGYQVLLDQPADAELFKHIVKETGKRAPESMRVEVPFDRLLAKADLTETTLWTGSTREKIQVPLGPQGAKRLQYLTLGTGTEHHIVCIGMPGSGKTNLMHIIITTMGLIYSPKEMQLYLVDFKQGVGFKRYAETRFPHAKVIAIDSEREFGLSVLQKLDRELNERGEKFRAAGVDAINDYRQKNPEAVLPRILLVVDEFQEFFSHDDNIATQASLLLDRLVRQGRYAGIHVMLGSQSLANRSSLPTSTLGQIGIRIALKCGESDARLIMGDGNLQARLLSRPGEAIYNSANGLLEGNSFFQVALFSEEDRNRSLADIRRFAEQAGLNGSFEAPVVFEGNAPARFEACKALEEAIAVGNRSETLKGASAWLGEPIAIRPPTMARFRRQGGNNLLIVTRDEEEGVGVTISSLISLLAQYGPKAARFLIFNLTTADSEWNELPSNLSQAYPHDIQLVTRKNIRQVLNELVKESNRRIEHQSSSDPEIYFVVLGLHRARDLREDDDGLSRYSSGPKAADLDPHAAFLTLLREGPESGIHVITWCDAYAGIARIDRRILGEFSMRVAGAMSNEDSGRLIDDPAASKLDKAHRAIFYDEERPGQLEKFRPYSIPDRNWIHSFASRAWPRSNKAQNA
jgi:DNA segregation ATPase FtsK/SpoIIIE, S-DNA-T family